MGPLDPKSSRGRAATKLIIAVFICIYSVYGAALEILGISAYIYAAILIAAFVYIIFHAAPNHRKAWLQERAEEAVEKEKFEQWMRQHEAEKAASVNSDKD